jgi:hypothetical protein
MKRRMNTFTRFVAAGVLAVGLAACGTTFTLVPDSTVPFAQGQLDVSFEDNGNGHHTLKVIGLGEPSKLVPTATTYVVWVKPMKEGAAAQNMGALTVNSDMKGELDIKTTFQSFEISVTAEAAADVLAPTGRPLLSAKVSSD